MSLEEWWSQAIAHMFEQGTLRKSSNVGADLLGLGAPLAPTPSSRASSIPRAISARAPASSSWRRRLGRAIRSEVKRVQSQPARKRSQASHLSQRAFHVLRPCRSGCAEEQTGSHCGKRDCISHDTPPATRVLPFHATVAVAASTASPRRSTIVSICAASTMNGGAIRT
jgi:hypothetical protein